MGLVTGLVIAGTAISAASQVASAGAARAAANDAIKEGNRLAGDAILRGEEDVTRYAADLARFVGRQRAAAAASNVDATAGSAAQVIDETQRFGEMDIGTIRANALREAYALRAGGQNAAAQYRMQARQQLMGAFSTALSAGAQGWEVYRQSRSIRPPPRLQPPGARSNISVQRPTFGGAGYP